MLKALVIKQNEQMEFGYIHFTVSLAEYASIKRA
jgi:hypothetical protein